MRPQTWFVDIDGVLLRHREAGHSRQSGSYELLEGAREFLDSLEAMGYCIVLCTSRKACERDGLERTLRSAGLYWDHLLTGLPPGGRVLVNDLKQGRPAGSAARAIETKRNDATNLVSD